MQTADDDKPRVEAVERAFSILEAFADGTARYTLGELAQQTGLYPSTLLRLANSMQRFGYLHRDGDGYFRLGSTLWRLGVVYQNTFDLQQHVRPVLRQLVEAVGETAAFYVREGEHRVCLYRAFAADAFVHHVEEGTSLPLDRGASAHMLKAFSEPDNPRYGNVRRERHAVSYGERNPQATAIALPLFGEQERFLGVISVVGPIERLTPEKVSRNLPVMQKLVDQLSRQLGSRAPLSMKPPAEAAHPVRTRRRPTR
jgi:DNA-binding IclR family transcriptional regulator